MKAIRFLLLPSLILLCISCEKTPEVNYDEARIPAYTLPDLLLTEKGEKIDSYAGWRNKRRPEILKLFADEMYGAYPSMDYSIGFDEKIICEDFLDGKAVAKEILATVQTENGSKSFSILYIFPRSRNDVPVFVALNFKGNHSIDTLSAISIPDAWVPNNSEKNINDNRSTEESRGVSSSRWPLASIIDHGYGLATVYYGEIDPDFDDAFKNGFHPLFAETGKNRDKHSTASISMWAKGMSFVADYLQQDSVADPTRIIAIGHSRLGKTSLWCGANDERFAAVISNNSGCGGAALSRREYGERVVRINTVFPHWFCDQFKHYNTKVNKLPVDQHMLIALMAPRPVYVASATEDQWADPKGEFLALKEARAVYQLLPGFDQSFPDVLPKAETPVHAKTGYHLRTGKHDLTEYDWINYMNWADRWLGK